MSKKFWLAVLAASFTFTTVCFAQGPRHAAGPVGGGRHADFARLETLKNYLDLTDSQITSLRQARTDAFERARPNVKDAAQKARELRDEMNKSNPDPATVGRLMTEMKQMRTQGQSSRTQVRQQSLAVLTEAQRTKLKALEEAAALQDAVREARASGLLDSPNSPDRGHMMRGYRPRR